MREMVERVRRAICAEQSDNPDYDPEMYENVAEAAIAAMREPTEVMIQAFWQAPDPTPYLPYAGPEPADAWHAMIDAALAEEKAG